MRSLACGSIAVYHRATHAVIEPVKHENDKKRTERKMAAVSIKVCRSSIYTEGLDYSTLRGGFQRKEASGKRAISGFGGKNS